MAGDPERRPPVRDLHVALFSTAAGFMIGALLVVYRLAWVRHTWPPGHPWVVVSTSCGVLIAYSSAFRPSREVRSRVGAGVVGSLWIRATILWVFAAKPS